MKIATLAAAAAFALALPLSASADKLPPEGSKSISDVVEKLKEQGYEPIVEVSFDDNKWQAEAYKEGQKYEIDVDAMSGEVVKSKRDS